MGYSKNKITVICLIYKITYKLTIIKKTPKIIRRNHLQNSKSMRRLRMNKKTTKIKKIQSTITLITKGNKKKRNTDLKNTKK